MAVKRPSASRAHRSESRGVLAGRRRPGESRVRTLNRLREFAVTLVGGIFGVGLLVNEVIAAIHDPSGVANHALAVVRISTVLLLLTAWFYGTGIELDAFDDLNGSDVDLVPPLPRTRALMVGAAAVALGGMALSYVSVLLFVWLFIVLKTVELMSSWPLHRTVREATDVAAARFVSDKSVTEAVSAVRLYYLGRPWVVVAAGAILAATICLAAAAYSTATADPFLGLSGSAVASLGLLLIVVVQEFITFHWRSSYGHDLDIALADAG